jgi:glutamyl-tRNA reductase
MQPEPVVVGVDHARAPLAIRERLAFAGPDLAEGLRLLSGYVGEGAILSTCNRTEVYAVVERGCPVTPLRRFLRDSRGLPERALDDVLYTRTRREAARHLFRVASGLESMILGEPQILGQVRDALASARAAGAAGPVLSRLFAEALRVGKLARTETGIARNRLSVPHAAVDLAADHLGGLRGRAAVVLGAGEMAALTAKLLRAAAVDDLAIANRTPERAAALAAATGGRAVAPGALGAELARADVAVSAAVAPRYLVDRATLDRGHDRRPAPLVVIDLAVPRSVDPALAGHDRVALFAVDDLAAVAAGHRERYAAEVARTEAIVDDAAGAFVAWLAQRAAVPTIAALRRRAEATRQRELEAALRKLGHLSERDRNVVAALSVGITNTLLHEPVTRLRGDVGAGDLAGAARRLFALETEAAAPDADGREGDGA